MKTIMLRKILFIVGGFLVICVAFAAVSFAMREGRPLVELLARPPSFPVKPDQNPVLLGRVLKGQDASDVLYLTNVTSEAVSISRIHTSCPCVSAVGRLLLIDAGSRVPVDVTYRSAIEPDFEGSLAVRCEVVGDDGKIVSEFTVELEVVGAAIRTANFPGGLRRR